MGQEQKSAASTTSSSDTVAPEILKEFKATLRGRLIIPADGEEYETARRVWNGMIDRRPALIVRAAGVSDVIGAVNFARTRKVVPIAVKGGGHNVAGFGTCDGGMLIDFSQMRSVRVDPAAKTARAEPGVTWREFDLETQAFGLAVTGGLVSTTGLAGFTLGGGVGWLVRKYGLTLDNLISADVVTADGKLVTASMTENPDLFWGVRGGGGNFGIVTSFELELHPVGPLVLGGLVLHPVDAAKDVLRFYREFVEKAPEELTTLPAFITAPPLPFIPAEYHGKKVLAAVGCYAGDIAEGTKLLEPLRKFGKPIADAFGPIPYRVLQSMLDEAAPPGVLNYWKSAYLSGLSDAAIDTIIENFRMVTSPLTAIHLHHLGGAMRRVGEDATAFSHREAKFILNIVSTWTEPSESESQMEWTRRFFAAMQKFSTGGVYVNFLGEEGGERVKSAYGADKYRRLVELKKKYDPDNLFRVNQNIPPV